MSAKLIHTPRKRFGQHFLQDQAVLQRLVEAIRPLPTDCLVEIGPGLGALTTRLLAKIPRLHAIEIDRDIVPRLIETCRSLTGKLVVHRADVLTYDFRWLSTTPGSLRIVGNLPYNISTPLLFHLLDYGDLIKDMHFMLQKEVVDRLVAGPGTKTYGRLSVMIQSRCQVEPLFSVGPHAFMPPPKVVSAVIRLRPAIRWEIKYPERFAAIVRQAFNYRRKMLRQSLKSLLSVQQLNAAGIAPTARPEQLAIQDFVRLSEASHAV